MSEGPFTIHGDEPVEARIVSWVLGEASSFEAAELERLCEERPELMIFKRRMLGLHGLLAEAENPKADEFWKLPPGKRRVVEDACGPKNVADMKQAREQRVKRSGSRALLAIAACLLLLVIVAGFTAPAVIKQRKSGRDLAHSRMVDAETKPDMPVSRRMVQLRADLPAELIEGTPAPIYMPKLDKLAARPAESTTWEMAKRSRKSDSRESGISGESPGKSSGTTTPESSLAKAVSDDTVSALPDLAETTRSLDFGDRADFGSGWDGGAANGGMQLAAEERNEGMQIDGLNMPNDSGLDPDSGARRAYSGLTFKDEDEDLREPAAQATKSLPGALVSNGTVIRQKEDKAKERQGEQAIIDGEKDIFYDRKSAAVRADEFEGSAYNLQVAAQDHGEAKKELGRDGKVREELQLKLPQKKAKIALMAGSRAKSRVMPRPEIEEIAAAEDPYSTFSLNISDASFQIAQAALAKGETPDPASIKVEQFYNAVDYGDPAPFAGEPVAVSIEQAAHPVIPGRNLVRIALKTAAAGRSASQPLRLTLLVDQSGSMVREDRRAAMNMALAGLSELLTQNDLVTVIGFSRTPHLLADGMTGDKAGKLANLVNQAASKGGTNLEEAIKLGEQLADRRKLAGAQNRIVLFTDGAANLGNADPGRLAERVKQLRQKGIAFDIAGIAADGLNDDLLGELARNGNGRYYVVGKGVDGDFAKQLAGAFRPAAENVKVQVRFNPERVGRYRLIGFEKDRLKTEDFRNDKVDAAELAAEEAGVAVYQVEPLPDGNGEIGEVSVRFRDTASDQMVERSWTIPHDTSAPVLDRASPSMQLAVLSMLASEKLKGGPLAEAIDFNQLIESAANVKQFYGNAGRVGEMLRMVDALK